MCLIDFTRHGIPDHGCRKHVHHRHAIGIGVDASVCAVDVYVDGVLQCTNASTDGSSCTPWGTSAGRLYEVGSTIVAGEEQTEAWSGTWRPAIRGMVCALDHAVWSKCMGIGARSDPIQIFLL